MIRTVKSKTTLSLLEKAKQLIEDRMKENPPVIPNKTLLKWVETYANNCFVIIEDEMQKSPQYKIDVDIYHQDFAFILSTVNQLLSKHNFSTLHAWMDRGMQEDLTKINQSLLPNRFNRRK